MGLPWQPTCMLQSCIKSACQCDGSRYQKCLADVRRSVADLLHARRPVLWCSEQLATAAQEELLQQRVSAAEDAAARASATAAALREEAGHLGTANGKLNADCETLRGRLGEAEPALTACQAQLQVSACWVVLSHEIGSGHPQAET
jgi:hypothetical protein